MCAKLTRKCQVCKLDDTNKDDMEIVSVDVGTKKVNKFYHKDCYEEFLKDKKFKEKEREELDKLVDVVMNIYGIKSIPNSIYPYFQDLRNGTRFFGKDNRKYKEGYTYELIAETFEYCSDTIEYWNSRKDFNGTTGAIKYGLAIVCDKLHFVEQRRKRRENQKQLLDIHVKNIKTDIDEHEDDNNYKKPTRNKGDFTDFLDD